MTVNGIKLRKNGPFARAMGLSLDTLAKALMDGYVANLDAWARENEPYPPFPEPTFEPNDPNDG